jgi:ABC-2 type transport system ATP-binding protein
MPDSYGSYAHTTVWEYLDFFARAFGLRGKERESAVEDVMRFTDLVELRDREMAGLSKGMSQRLCLGRTLLHDPEVLVLDEPAAGLDPKARVEFKRLVRLLAEEGKTIFISSHILSELEEMCDSVLFIDEGRIVHHGTAEALKTSHEGGVVYTVTVASSPDALVSFVELSPGMELVERTRTGVRVRLGTSEPRDVAEILRRLVSSGHDVIEFRREEKRLEQAFIETLQRSGGGRA